MSLPDKYVLISINPRDGLHGKYYAYGWYSPDKSESIGLFDSQDEALKEVLCYGIPVVRGGPAMESLNYLLITEAGKEYMKLFKKSFEDTTGSKLSDAEALHNFNLGYRINNLNLIGRC